MREFAPNYFPPLQWPEPTDTYKEDIYRKFIRTPVVWDKNLEAVDLEAIYDNPRDIFPDSYVDYIETLYGKEKDNTATYYYEHQYSTKSKIRFREGL